MTSSTWKRHRSINISIRRLVEIDRSTKTLTSYHLPSLTFTCLHLRTIGHSFSPTSRSIVYFVPQSSVHGILSRKKKIWQIFAIFTFKYILCMIIAILLVMLQIMVILCIQLHCHAIKIQSTRPNDCRYQLTLYESNTICIYF